MAAIQYASIREQIKSILEGDTRTSGAQIYIEEEPQFGLSDVQQTILIYFDRRVAPPGEQTLSAGKRLRYNLHVVLVVAYFSMESFKAACDGRDELLSNLELVLMANPTIGGTVNVSWLEGGEMYSVRNPQSNNWVAVAETTMVADVTAVNT